MRRTSSSIVVGSEGFIGGVRRISAGSHFEGAPRDKSDGENLLIKSATGAGRDSILRDVGVSVCVSVCVLGSMERSNSDKSCGSAGRLCLPRSIERDGEYAGVVGLEGGVSDGSGIPAARATSRLGAGNLNDDPDPFSNSSISLTRLRTLLAERASPIVTGAEVGCSMLRVLDVGVSTDAEGGAVAVLRDGGGREEVAEDAEWWLAAEADRVAEAERVAGRRRWSSSVSIGRTIR